MKKEQEIFSGPASEKLWERVNGAITVAQLRDALYFALCKCQELETRVENLEASKSPGGAIPARPNRR